jgi:CheY-like chemotaxis protein
LSSSKPSRCEQGSYRLRLEVRDTGIGIRQDRMDRCSQSFSQVDASTTRRYGGTGLGLAISKRLVELMAGRSPSRARRALGSTFRIELTANAAAVPVRISRDDAIPHLAGSGPRRRRQCDQSRDREPSRAFVGDGSRWRSSGPSDALDLVANGEPFDIAVLDLMMPDMDGITLARAIRRHRPERELPLVLLTSIGRLPEARSSGVFTLELAEAGQGIPVLQRPRASPRGGA